jgi:hypothetical protein
MRPPGEPPVKGFQTGRCESFEFRQSGVDFTLCQGLYPDGPRHPFIEGLLQTLPEPEDDWPTVARVKWLQTAANIFDLIYKGDGGIKIEMAIAQRSPRPSE